MGSRTLICARCNVEMEPADVHLTYLGHQLTHKFPTCPVCKQVFIPEEDVTGKIAQVERELEDK